MSTLAYGALWVFVFALPWERLLVLPGVSLVARVTGAIALTLAILAVVTSGRLRRLHVVHIAGLLFVLWAACVLLIVKAIEIPPKFWTFVQLYAVLWMIWELARTRERQIGLLVAYVAGAHVAAMNTVLLYRSQGEAMRRFSIGGADPNESAMLLALALPMAWFLGLQLRRPALRWAARAYLPLGLVALGLTGSRGGMLASVVGLSLVPLTLPRLSPGRQAIAAILLAVSFIVAALNTPETLIQRLASTTAEVEEANLGGRGKIWVAGIQAFGANPIVGYGTGNFKRAVRPFGAGQVAHNSFLSVLVEQGLVGLVFYLTMFVGVWLSLLNLRGLDRRFALVLFVQLGVAMTPLTWEDQRAVWVILAMLLGFSQATIAFAAQRAAFAGSQPAPVPVPRARGPREVAVGRYGPGGRNLAR